METRFIHALGRVSEKNIIEAGLGDAGAEFVQHYVRFNGGVPEPEWLPETSDWDALIVQTFFPIKFFKLEISETIEWKRDFLISKKLISADSVPFGCDPGGNYFILECSSGKIYYLPMDEEIDSADRDNYYLKHRRFLCPSFRNFIDLLTDEDSAYN